MLKRILNLFKKESSPELVDETRTLSYNDCKTVEYNCVKFANLLKNQVEKGNITNGILVKKFINEFYSPSFSEELEVDESNVKQLPTEIKVFCREFIRCGAKSKDKKFMELIVYIFMKNRPIHG